MHSNEHLDHSSQSQAQQAAELMAKLMVITEQMVKRVADLDQRSGQIEQSLLRTERSVQDGLNASALHFKQVTSQTVSDAVKQPTQLFESDVKNITNTLAHSTNKLQKQQQEMAGWLKALVWKALAGLTLASIVTMLGMGYVAWDRAQEIKRANFSKEILDAAKAGIINVCDGKLCVRVEKNAQRFGSKSEFLIVE